MPDKVVQQIVTQGSLLGKDGQELKKGIWETCVYLGKNDFVYYLTAESLRGEIKIRIAGKRTDRVGNLCRSRSLPQGGCHQERTPFITAPPANSESYFNPQPLNSYG